MTISQKDYEKFKEMYDYKRLVEYNKEKVKKAPITVIIAMDTMFFNDLPRNFKATDAKVFFRK